MNADFIGRRLAIQESGNDEDEVRRLMESTPLGTLSKSPSELRDLLNLFIDGQSVIAELPEGESTFFYNVNSISSFTNGNGDTCDVYNNVEVSNLGETVMVRVEGCPGDEYCSYFGVYDTSRKLESVQVRRLEKPERPW